jgi:hypothetical protein
MSDPSNKVKWHCNVCLDKRWPTVLYEIVKKDVSETHGADFDVKVTNYTLAECNGCE